MKLLIALAALGVAVLSAPAEDYIQPAYWPAEPFEFTNSSRLGIVAGHDAARNQFPYQISLRIVSGSSLFHICGGSILSQRWVVSAAHCTTEYAVSVFRVTAGILLQTDSGIANQQTVSVSQIINHPLYPGGDVVAPNDISVIRLASLLNYGANVQPITLPTSGATPSGTGVVSGWGLLGLPTNRSPNNLQFVNVPIITAVQCGNRISQLSGPNNPFSSTLNVCTTSISDSSRESVCSGDSGGPLVAGSRLVGIVSWGYSPCGISNIPSVFVRTSSYINWINQNTNNLSN